MGTGHCGEPCRRRALSLSASATKGEDLKVIHVLAFYLFAALVIASGALTIFARNPVHSVLWLIMAFFNAAGLMVLLQAEFIAMLLVIVYVGAVAVLFLFVVMMLDIDFAELRAGFVEYLPFGALIAILLVTEIVLGVGAWKAGGIELGQARKSVVEGKRGSVIVELGVRSINKKKKRSIKYTKQKEKK